MLKKLIVLLLFLSIHLFAAETVYAWGYGDLLVETLKAVKYMFSIGEFRDFWKIAVLISMISAVLMMLTPNPDFLKLPKIFIFTMGIYALFVTAKIDVYVDDKADNTNSGVVTQVPWAVGYPLALFSALEYRIGATYETATSIPNGMKYSDSGFMTPISIFNQATSHKIVTPFLYQNLDNYIMECVMPDIENGYKDYRTLISNDNVWSYLGNTSPAIFMLYNDQDNNTSLKTCTEVYSSLNSLLTAYVGTSGEGMEYLGKSLGMLSSSAVSSKLGIANQYLSNSSKNASQLLLQTTAINMFSETFRSYAAMNGASVENAAFHSASAGQAASAQMVVSGILGSKYIPIMKGVLTAIIVGLTPILALMMATPMAFKLIMGYITILAWLCAWHFGEAILNHIMLTKTQSALNSYGDLIFQNKGLIQSTMTDYINMAASMYWTVPTIAGLIVTGFSLSAFMSLNNAMTTKLDRTASAIGGDMGKGNMNFGNVGHNTYSANKLDALASQVMGNSFRYDDLATSSRGSKSEQFNSLSSQSGSQAFGGGLGASWSNSALAQQLGTSYDFNTGNFKGEDIGRGQKQATSGGTIQSTNSSGENVTFDYSGGAIFQKGDDGKYQPYTGTFTAKHNGESITSVWEGGVEKSRTLEDQQKNKMEVTTENNGVDKSFKWESGQDKGSFLSGIYHAKSGSLSVTDGIVHGRSLKKDDSGMITFNDGDATTFMKEVGKVHDNSRAKGEEISTNTSKDDRQNRQEDFKTGASASAGGNIGFLGAKADISKQYTSAQLDSTGKTLSVTDKDGKVEKWSLTEGERDSLQKIASNMRSESSGVTASKDLTGDRLQSIVQDSLNKGQDVNTTMKNIVQNKDAYHSGSVAMTKNGAASEASQSIGNAKESIKGAPLMNMDISDDSKKTKNEVLGSYELENGKGSNAEDTMSKAIDDNIYKALGTAALATGVGAYVSKDKIMEMYKKNGGDFNQTVADLSAATEKADSALKTGKGGKGTKEAFEALGLEEHAKKEGFVFNKDGSVDADKTRAGRSIAEANRRTESYINSTMENNKGVPKTGDQIGRDMLAEQINKDLANATTPKEINNLNKLKDDVLSGKEISNQRLASAGYGKQINSSAPIEIDSIVQTKDRGNFGTVTGINKDGSYNVHFVNPETGKEATIKYSEENLTNTKKNSLQGNFDFSSVGNNYAEKVSYMNPGDSRAKKTSLDNDGDTKHNQGGSVYKKAAYIIGGVTGSVALGSVLNPAGTPFDPTSLGQGSDQLPLRKPENPFSQGQNNSSVNFKTDGSAGNIDTPTKGITETLKVMETNKNKAPQQVEEVKEKK